MLTRIDLDSQEWCYPEDIHPRDLHIFTASEDSPYGLNMYFEKYTPRAKYRLYINRTDIRIHNMDAQKVIYEGECEDLDTLKLLQNLLNIRI